MIDPVAYRRLTSMVRMLNEDGHLTTAALHSLAAVLDDELRRWEEKQ
jgi:hypothetical protein